ncbi:hypothetical protein SAMN04489724_1171 [Algoriphagus locisalis]|uniref:TonB protein C-terminal n=1 Tax=Algoriphagus locisalis TaxID=305507 RepID=A0A1I6YRA2_9BACT|nr:hypothetical protein [Algoriphagus locisalis]SFT52983.1 hypothetical protein SAMN04489724_1171 [Algoriphagus locisalis]
MVKTVLLVALLFLSACSSEKEAESQADYLRWVGDIPYDPDFDKADFKLCHGDSNARQYFNFGQGFQYEGEKLAMVQEFKNSYKPVGVDDSGLIRIRFLVNCKGESGRFRVIAMDNNYNEMVFDKRITNQLLQITKQLDGWKILPTIEEPLDYYQYLIFKIEEGNILEILP